MKQKVESANGTVRESITLYDKLTLLGMTSGGRVALQSTWRGKLEHRSNLRDAALGRVRLITPSAFTATRLALVPARKPNQSKPAHRRCCVIYNYTRNRCLRRAPCEWLRVSTRLGAYFDALTDFVVILATFYAFIPRGFCADWVPAMITFVFAEFILTSLIFREIYDPVGKYMGSLLYGIIALRFIFAGSFSLA